MSEKGCISILLIRGNTEYMHIGFIKMSALFVAGCAEAVRVRGGLSKYRVIYMSKVILADEAEVINIDVAQQNLFFFTSITGMMLFFSITHTHLFGMWPNACHIRYARTFRST